MTKSKKNNLRNKFLSCKVISVLSLFLTISSLHSSQSNIIGSILKDDHFELTYGNGLKVNIEFPEFLHIVFLDKNKVQDIRYEKMYISQPDDREHGLFLTSAAVLDVGINARIVNIYALCDSPIGYFTINFDLKRIFRTEISFKNQEYLGSFRVGFLHPLYILQSQIK